MTAGNGCAAEGYLLGEASVRCLWPPLVTINAVGATLDAKPVYGTTATNPVNRPSIEVPYHRVNSHIRARLFSAPPRPCA